MTSDFRPSAFIGALLVLIALAPFNAKFAGTFRDVARGGDFFALIASTPARSFGGEWTEEERTMRIRAAFGGVALEAGAAIVWDVEEGRAIFALNEKEPLALASLTKLATAVVGERLAESISAPGRIVPITEEAIREDGDDGFYAGEQFYFSDIRDAMLVKSSNDAAAAIAAWAEHVLPASGGSGGTQELVFVNEMNRVVAEAGLSSAYFLNATGLDLTSERAGAIGSAEDIARFFTWIVKQMPQILFATQMSSIDVISQGGDRHHFMSSGESALAIPGLIGVKTGFTDLARGNVVIAWSALGRSYVVVVLGSTREGRFSDVLTLYRATMDFFGASAYDRAL